MKFKSFIKSVILFWGYLIHRNNNSKVLFYHDVGLNYTDMGTPLDIIKGHVNAIRKSGFEIVSSINQNSGQIMICFDDGWSGLYNAKDFFVREKIFPTIFIAVNLIGTKGHMTVDQIRELLDLGFIFQAHSWSHDDLTQYDEKDLHRELVESKVSMERMLTIKFDAICFPKGYFNKVVVSKSLQSGYTRLFSSIWGGYYDLARKDIICRNLVQDIPPYAIKYVLKGASPYLTSRYLKQHFKE